ncbi:ribosomal protein S5 domain 2-like protein [Amylostereum chailletii]|nr:ribosomal protein S5 domain 2-like protein [Amylostereum chailletii]KAI0313027.1 ribosomal protein S5 domain 2-like protein [Amylostereum chailletii]
MANLDAFVSHSQPLPECLATSSEISDRDSVFVGYIYRASNASEARAAASHLKRVVHARRPASHEMFAYRCMELKYGKSGLAEDDFHVVEASEDDNEQWAGGRVLKVMREEAVMDAVVIVSRWYGGTMLGPVRFTHIEDCARQVCRAFRLKDEMDDCVSTLTTLDGLLTKLRADLEATRDKPPTPPLPPPPTPPQQAPASSSFMEDAPPLKKRKVVQDYSELRRSGDLPKAKRLITARESAIRSVRALIEKAKAKASHAGVVETPS